jgi:hypothetical protein
MVRVSSDSLPSQSRCRVIPSQSAANTTTPAAHSVQFPSPNAPRARWYFPGAQYKHALAEVAVATSEYFPAPHGTQAEMLVSPKPVENVPDVRHTRPRQLRNRHAIITKLDKAGRKMTENLKGMTDNQQWCCWGVGIFRHYKASRQTPRTYTFLLRIAHRIPHHLPH